MRYVVPVVLIPLTLSQSGCLYAVLGVEHNYTVAERLDPGLSYQQAIDILSDGGTATVDREIGLPESGDWTKLLDQHVIAELVAAAARVGKPVANVVIVKRFWGFGGYGEFYLFLDSHTALVGHHLLHIN